jgi:hypothetical protein
MKSFWYYFLVTIFIPRRAFNRLLSEPAKVAKATKSILFIGILYALTAAALVFSGALLMVPAWLKLSSENYYFWEIFFVIPVFVLDWILAAGLVLWLSRGGKKKGSGTFEDTLSILGFAMAIPLFIAWIPQAAGAILLLLGMVQQEFVDLVSGPGFWQGAALIYIIVVLLWLFILSSIAVSVSQKLRWWKAILVSFLTVAVFVFVLFIFIR